MSGLDNYDNDVKREWRGWAWNRITERLTVSPRDATVLYLCGPNDFDRERGLRLGYRNRNLIAVDSSEEHIARVRENGGIGICTDIYQLLYFWNDAPVDALLLDFCTHLEGVNWASLFYSPAMRHRTQVCMNIQRGRESADFADAVGRIQSVYPQSWFTATNVSTKQRALACISLIACKVAESHAGRAIESMELIESARLQKAVHHEMDPIWRSYRSQPANRVTFDSAVFSWPVATGHVLGRISSTRREQKECARRLAALKAIRTRMAA